MLIRTPNIDYRKTIVKRVVHFCRAILHSHHTEKLHQHGREFAIENFDRKTKDNA
ncbi:hypothetical protein FSU_2701 [Fibrobacter succinogenes subsp. succinogenes S85]|uniref:Uncharacterized protein n=1 Tax=Fibrobacter succinogenes (strain ATCC 19169 / S85) TaxID=59374 RepID=D9S696_FIBSS|nr:hypothetical protein FSU_2701 [Fibrobacter succinogenes subsp. succinogenes S85]